MCELFLKYFVLANVDPIHTLGTREASSHAENRVRWWLAVAMVAGLMLTSAVGGTAAEEPQPTRDPKAPADSSRSAESMHLFLKANGAKIEGDSSAPTKAGGGSIELLAFENAVVTPREAGSGLATGRRQYQPLLIRKRIDKSSPCS